MMSRIGTQTLVFIARLDSDQESEVPHLLGVPIELLLFGVYIIVFGFSVAIVHRQKGRFISSTSLKVFFCANVLLFILTIAHTFIGLSRIVQAFVNDTAGPNNFFIYPTISQRWENLAFELLLLLSMNIGDALVIYRCYIIWSRTISVVALPIFLAFCSYAIGITMVVSYSHPDLISQKILRDLRASLFPVHFAQNILTTFLIVWRLWKRHRASNKAGIRNLGISLVQIARYIVESAMVYTTILLGLIILDFWESKFLFTLQYALVPSIGITFNFISIRAYWVQVSAAARMLKTSEGGFSSGLTPPGASVNERATPSLSGKNDTE